MDRVKVWRALSPQEREVFEGVVLELGLDDWTEQPGLATLLPILAAHRIASSRPEVDYTPALLDAGAELGIDGASVARTIRRWLRASGQFVLRDSDDAA